MQDNDIISFQSIGYGAIFEDLLASPPEGIKSLGALLHKARNNWDKFINQWKPHDLPLKALYDTTNRLGVGAEIYTFLHPDAAPAIESWLARKGITSPVIYYESPQLLEYDLRFKRAVRTIFVPHKDQAAILGIRATVTPSTSAWVL